MRRGGGAGVLYSVDFYPAQDLSTSTLVMVERVRDLIIYSGDFCFLSFFLSLFLSLPFLIEFNIINTHKSFIP